MTPRAEALAYRIWGEANPIGWDCTAADLAEALGETPQRIGMICKAKGWTHRLRTNPSNTDERHHRPGFVSAALAVETGGRIDRAELAQ